MITTLTPPSLTHSSCLLIPSLTPPPYPTTDTRPACDSKMGLGRMWWVDREGGGGVFVVPHTPTIPSTTHPYPTSLTNLHSLPTVGRLLV